LTKITSEGCIEYQDEDDNGDGGMNTKTIRSK